MLKIRFRNWVRAKLGTSPTASPRDQGYLDSLPWLIQLIPLGGKISQRGVVNTKGIRVTTITELARMKNDSSSSNRFDGYFVDEKGEVLGTIKQPEYSVSARSFVLHKLKELGDSAFKVKYVVRVYRGYHWVEVTIYKFPRLRYQIGDLANHMQEAREAEAVIVEQAENAAKEEYETARSKALTEAA